MHQNVIGKNVRLTDNVRKHIASKMQKIKHYSDKILDAHIVCQHIQNDYIVEITLVFGKKVFHTEEVNNDLYVAIDNLFVKIEREVEKMKDKATDHRVRADNAGIEHQSENAIEYDMDVSAVFHKPIDEVEAMLQLKASDKNFLAYFPILSTGDLYNIKVGGWPVFICKNNDIYIEVSYNEIEDFWFKKTMKLTDDKHIVEIGVSKYLLEEYTASEAISKLSDDTKYFVYLNTVVNSIECVYREGEKKIGIIRTRDF